MRDLALESRARAGVALVDVLSTLAIASLVTASLFLLMGTTIKGRFITHARVSDQERGRQAMAWLADRMRQVNYDAAATCRDGLVRIGSGNGFSARLAFRAVIDRAQSPPRRTYVYFVENRTLWENVLAECADDSVRGAPTALTPPIVDALTLTYYDGAGTAITNPTDAYRVQTVRLTITVSAASALGRAPETQMYSTLIAPRGP